MHFITYEQTFETLYQDICPLINMRLIISLSVHFLLLLFKKEFNL
jgi:hypothetical protein